MIYIYFVSYVHEYQRGDKEFKNIVLELDYKITIENDIKKIEKDLTLENGEMYDNCLTDVFATILNFQLIDQYLNFQLIGEYLNFQLDAN